MAVYKRTYKTYDGPLTPSWSRFGVVARYSFATLFKSRIFTGFTVLSFFPLLIAVAQIYFIHNPLAQSLLDMRMGNLLKIDNRWFAQFLAVQAWMGFMLAAGATPGMVSKDFANHALQLYLSRPLSRLEYLLGKIAVIATLLSAITWIPGLLLFALQAQLEGHGWVWDNFYLVGSIIVSGWLWIAVISLMMLALSVWVKWRIAATGLILGVFFLLPGFAEAFNAIMRTEWGRLFNLPYVLNVIWLSIYRIDPAFLHLTHQDRIPVWSAWAAVLTICLASAWLLNEKLKAREVERG
jgi:ABC-2 type transport system permease protein